jgi:hypothetical protein
VRASYQWVFMAESAEGGEQAAGGRVHLGGARALAPSGKSAGYVE